MDLPHVPSLFSLSLSRRLDLALALWKWERRPREGRHTQTDPAHVGAFKFQLRCVIHSAPTVVSVCLSWREGRSQVENSSQREGEFVVIVCCTQQYYYYWQFQGCRVRPSNKISAGKGVGAEGRERERERGGGGVGDFMVCL